MTWSELLKVYQEHLAELGRSLPTQQAYRRCLARFVESCVRQGAAHPGSVTSELLAAFQRELLGRSNQRGGLLSPSSQWQSLMVVRSWLRWATRHGHLLVDPSRDLVLRAPLRPLGRVPSRCEMESLLAAPSHNPYGLRDRAILDTFYSAGLRLGECQRLNLEDLDLAQRLLMVRQGKGAKDRLLPVLPRLAETLECYLKGGRPKLSCQPQERALWLARGGYRLPPISLWDRVQTHALRAGLGALSPHRLRHAFAVHLMEGGAELAVIQALLGHAQPSTTEIYTRLSLLELTREYRRTHPRA